MKKVIVGIVALAIMVPLYASDTTLSDLMWQIKAVRSKLFQLEDRVEDNESKIEVLSSDTPDFLAINCGENPNAAQEAHDAGYTRIYTGLDNPPDVIPPCAPLVITHPLYVWGESASASYPFEKISVYGTKAEIADTSILGDLEIYNSAIRAGDLNIGGDLRLFNSQWESYSAINIDGDAELSGSDLFVIDITVGGSASTASGRSPKLIARQSNLAGSFNFDTIILETGSNLELLYYWKFLSSEPAQGVGGTIDSGTTVVCDPQTTRIYDPFSTLSSPPVFQPSQNSSETCLVNETKVYR